MKKMQHRTNNDVLGAPPGTPIEECEALPITRLRFEDGTRGVASYWTPSEDELALLKRGAAVRLIVLGTTHAPLILGVDGDGLL